MVTLRNEEMTEGVMGRLLAFYQTEQTILHSYQDFENLAKKFIEEEGTPDKLELDTQLVNFSEDNFNFNAETKTSERLRFVINFQNLFTALRNVLEHITPEQIEYHPFKRQASPPLSAYNYVGHNDLDITRSNRSYSLMFE